MTAELIPMPLDPGLAAFRQITNPTTLLTPEQMRQACWYAARRTVMDPDWLTAERREFVRHGAVTLRFLPDFDARWSVLLDAVRSQHGPRIMRALDGLVAER